MKVPLQNCAMVLCYLALNVALTASAVSNWNAGCTLNLTGIGPRLEFPFCNASLALDLRLSDLLARMTPEEKCSNLVNGVPRLGIPVFSASEDTHGIGCGCGEVRQSFRPLIVLCSCSSIMSRAQAADMNSTGCPTTFPNGPGLGA